MRPRSAPHQHRSRLCHRHRHQLWLWLLNPASRPVDVLMHCVVLRCGCSSTHCLLSSARWVIVHMVYVAATWLHATSYRCLHSAHVMSACQVRLSSSSQPPPSQSLCASTASPAFPRPCHIACVA